MEVDVHLAQVKHRDPKTGTIYVYSSHKKWDKEAKKYKDIRKLIGKLDQDGNLVPTGRVGRRKKNADVNAPPINTASNDRFEELYYAEHKRLEETANELSIVRQKNLDLSVRNERLTSTLEKMVNVALLEFPEFCPQ